MQSNKIPVIRGTVFLGAPCTGKSFLMQYRALDALRRQQEAHLIYVAAPARQDPIIALQPGARVVKEVGGLMMIEAERMTAYLCDTDICEAGRAGTKAAMDAITNTLALAALPENRHKYILAIDELFAFFREEDERDALFELLETVLGTPTSALTFLITFQSVTLIEVGFGERGVELFRRFHEKFIFKSYDTHAGGSFANCGGINPMSLHRGEAIHIYHNSSDVVDIGLGDNGAVKIKPHELSLVGFWRMREIRGGGMTELEALLLCALLYSAIFLALFVASFFIPLELMRWLNLAAYVAMAANGFYLFILRRRRCTLSKGRA